MKKSVEKDISPDVALLVQASGDNERRLRFRRQRLRVLLNSELQAVVGASTQPNCYTEQPTVCHTV
jgi:hypothetical protein